MLGTAYLGYLTGAGRRRHRNIKQNNNSSHFTAVPAVYLVLSNNVAGCNEALWCCKEGKAASSTAAADGCNMLSLHGSSNMHATCCHMNPS